LPDEIASLPMKAHDVLVLLFRVQHRLCALALEHVVETMRPLPVEPVPRAPAFVRGLAIIRGAPTPVVDVARLIGAAESRPGRFVTLAIGDRTAALAVDAVLGVRSIPAASIHELPPLLRDATADIVSAVGLLHAELLVVLRGARLIPEELWAALDAGRGAP
jgi:purine-binding chemotaxis protein CheW